MCYISITSSSNILLWWWFRVHKLTFTPVYGKPGGRHNLHLTTCFANLINSIISKFMQMGVCGWFEWWSWLYLMHPFHKCTSMQKSVASFTTRNKRFAVGMSDSLLRLYQHIVCLPLASNFIPVGGCVCSLMHLCCSLQCKQAGVHVILGHR